MHTHMQAFLPFVPSPGWCPPPTAQPPRSPGKNCPLWPTVHARVYMCACLACGRPSYALSERCSKGPAGIGPRFRPIRPEALWWRGRSRRNRLLCLLEGTGDGGGRKSFIFLTRTTHVAARRCSIQCKCGCPCCRPCWKPKSWPPSSHWPTAGWNWGEGPASPLITLSKWSQK